MSKDVLLIKRAFKYITPYKFIGTIILSIFLVLCRHSGYLMNITKLNANVQQVLTSLERAFGLMDNLLLGKVKASDEEIYNACKKAYIHDFIMSMPQDYNSIIGENGVNLSGGQKQGIAIVRALLENYTIILFDEAASSLDNESQYYIRKAINNLSENHTIMIIAHRLSTIIEADEIMVIDKGMIVGYGNHEFLINNNSIYKHLYDTEINVLKVDKEVI
ncbi:ATP-binding cassette domain-containing protein [Clostridium felsineum]|uniref:ATP-binding cassette domain-containing protein n=1 Tax=Clostridium felsineum TaxID=36839 RepID=UPI00214DD363|nr:ATP-binding cassette domain-containing protein [Clostridium felsineum]MCR3759783.1 ATP-binding cassette domain-containing protein [Clostridium felsineum]